MTRKHRIAVLPGDGIGKETVPESLKVLDAAARRFGFDLELTHYDWSCETFKETGEFMPKDGMDQLAKSDSILLGAVGWPGVPDHVSLWGLLIPIRRGFDQYANIRPCKLMPGVYTPLANRTEKDIDFYVVRENTEGEYSSVGGRMFEGTDREFASQQAIFTRKGTVRWEKGEPFCFITLMQDKPLADFQVIQRSFDSDPEWRGQYDAWHRQRSDFNKRIFAMDPEATKEAWQRFYFKGELPEDLGDAPQPHVNKRRLRSLKLGR